MPGASVGEEAQGEWSGFGEVPGASVGEEACRRSRV